MGVLDAPILQAVQTALNAVGGSATLKLVVKTYEPTEGESVVLAPQQWSCKCSPPYPFKQSQINGTSIKAKDFQLVVPAQSLLALDPPVIPDIHMTIIRGGVEYTIVDVSPLDSGDQVVAWTLHCRG